MRRLLLSRSTGSRTCGLQQLQFPSSRGQTQQLWYTGLVAPGMWDHPRSGIEPVSPASAYGFSTMEPLEKPLDGFINKVVLEHSPTHLLTSICDSFCTAIAE